MHPTKHGLQFQLPKPYKYAKYSSLFQFQLGMYKQNMLYNNNAAMS